MIKVSEPASEIVLLPITVLSQVFGHVFVHGYGRRWMRIAHRLVIFSVLVLVFLHEVPSILFWLRASEGLHRTLVKFETSSRWILFFLNFLVTTFNSGRVKGVIRDLLKQDFHLSDGESVKVFRFHLLHLAVNFFLLVAYDVLGHDYVWSNSNHNAVTSTVYIFNDLVILWSGLLFIHIANVVRVLFRDMNAKMSTFSAPGPNVDVDAIRSDVIKFRHLHLHLYNTCKKINSCFSLQLLCIILFAVIQTTYALRAFISEVLRPDIGDRAADAVLNIIWGMLYMFFVYQIIAIGDHTAFESQRSSLIVHHLMNDHFESRRLEKELELFSLQIHQHQAVFSIWLFDLKFTLLNTVVGVLATYIIILITFQEEWKHGGLSGWDFKSDG